MERYVNDGSPSGFTFTHTTSEHTRPRSAVPSFSVPIVHPKPNVTVHSLGHWPEELFGVDADPAVAMFVHPDMRGHAELATIASDVGRSRFLAVPTASGRTLWLRGAPARGYIKLHYHYHLGRILRRITLRHAQAALETDSLLAELIAEGRMPQTFAYLRETGARVYSKRDASRDSHWGMIWRPADIHGVAASQVAYLIPAFSLFAENREEGANTTLLAQLGEVHGEGRVAFLIDEILVPLLTAYFAMIAVGGLQGEWHAQNVLFAFDSSWHCVATVLRDLESVDRDLPLMAAVRPQSALASYPYKCLDAGDYNYAIRHSFMFDHKFGEYLLAPLIDHGSALWGVDPKVFDRVIVDFVTSQVKTLPADFFPKNGCWYKFAPQLIDQTTRQRPYVELTCPRFRPRVVRGAVA